MRVGGAIFEVISKGMQFHINTAMTLLLLPLVNPQILNSSHSRAARPIKLCRKLLYIPRPTKSLHFWLVSIMIAIVK